MILEPLIPPVVTVLLFAVVVFFVVRGFIRSTDVGQRVLWVVRLFLVAACAVLLLGPAVPGQYARVAASSVDVLLVVDTTSSIVAEDYPGYETRLDGVRADAEKLIDAYPGARFALITFDGEAILRMPFTNDTSALDSALQVLRPEFTMYSSGSSISIANKLVMNTLRAAAEVDGDRARMVFYFGDGEQTSNTKPATFSESQPYVDGGAVLGYGTASGGPMKERMSYTTGTDRYIQYQGSNALSVIDEANLQKIASELGVTYIHRDGGVFNPPAAPTTTIDYTSTSSTQVAGSLSWTIAIVVAALLAFEIARATMRIVQLRSLAAPARKRGDR